MSRPSARYAVAALLALAIGSVNAPAHATRPTPHQRLDAALQPITEQLTALHVTDAERHDIDDVMQRAETVAADLVTAQQRGATDRVTALTRRIELLARIARGRIEAQRAEAQAVAREQAALEAEARRVQSRAALERAAERRLEIERGGALQTSSTASAATEAPSSAAPSHAANASSAPASASAAPSRGAR